MSIYSILQQLSDNIPKKIKLQYPIPSAWCVNEKDVKAVLLGCDPTNNFTHCMPFVFFLGSDMSKFDAFKNGFEKDLNVIGLDWNSVYVQNLCKNYFSVESSKNSKWIDAAQYWIPSLIEELGIFDASIPVLMTSDLIFKALVEDWEKYGETIDFYTCKVDIPIPANENRLHRPLIPFYRGRNPAIGKSYRLGSGNWNDYAERVRNCIFD